MIKVVSFSVFGSNPKYMLGMLENIKLVEIFYPGWECWIYFDDTVPNNIIDEYTGFSSVWLFNMSKSKFPGMFWRFLPDTDIFIARDADSRISEREVAAVNEWIDSGKRLHIMRDHPHHKFNILGGMWGFRHFPYYNFKRSIKTYLKDKKYNTFTRAMDMSFLSDVVYPRFIGDSFVHASYHAREEWCKPFPIEMEDRHFVGEIFNEYNEREEQYKCIK